MLSRTDSPDNYYIIEYNGKTASELYNNVLSSISAIYKSPDKGLSKVDNVSVSVTALAEVETVVNDKFTALNKFDYTLHFLFKDGKIRVNAPSFDSDNILHFNELYGRWQKVPPSFSIQHFTGNDGDFTRITGEYDKFALSFEKHLNDIITEIIRKSETINNW